MRIQSWECGWQGIKLMSCHSFFFISCLHERHVKNVMFTSYLMAQWIHTLDHCVWTKFNYAFMWNIAGHEIFTQNQQQFQELGGKPVTFFVFKLLRGRFLIWHITAAHSMSYYFLRGQYSFITSCSDNCSITQLFTWKFPISSARYILHSVHCTYQMSASTFRETTNDPLRIQDMQQ